YSVWENLLHRNLRLPDECPRLRKSRRDPAVAGLFTGGDAGRSGACPLQHLQHSRQGRTEGLQPPAELQARGDEGQSLRRAGAVLPSRKARRFSTARLTSRWSPARPATPTSARCWSSWKAATAASPDSASTTPKPSTRRLRGAITRTAPISPSSKAATNPAPIA